MKTRKNSKLLILVLTLALLIGSVFAITASAAEAETGDLYSVTINHNDKISIAFVVKATQAEINNSTVAVKYTWEGGEEQTAVYHSAHAEPGYVYVVTNGVAAYDLTKTLTFTVYTNGVAGETGTYSVAHFLYNKLYRDGATGAKKDVYETLIAYGAASQIYFDKNTEVMIDDLDYVYSKNANVKFGGKSYVLGATSATATYSGTGNVEAWIINGQEIASTATTYEVTVDGVVSVDIKVQCVHADANPKDHNCDYCGANEFGTCEDTDKNHNCDYCGAELSTCADGNNDHNCDVCGTKLSDCVDAGKDHACDICGGNVGGECADTNPKDHNCDYCGNKMSDHVDTNPADHDCDYCGAEDVTNHIDNDTNHTCDICGETANCTDANPADGYCDACGAWCFENGIPAANSNFGMTMTHASAYTGGTTTSYVYGTDEYDTFMANVTYNKTNMISSYTTKLFSVADPEDATNMVLQIANRACSKTTHSNIDFAIRDKSASGEVFVIDFDYYMDYATGNKNAPVLARLQLVDGDSAVSAEDVDSITSIISNVYQANEGASMTKTDVGSTDDVQMYEKLAGAFLFGGDAFDSHTWYKFKLVWADGKVYMYYSTNDGLNYTLAQTASFAIADTTAIDTFRLVINSYNNTSRQYVDTLSAYRVDSATVTTADGVDAYHTHVDSDNDHKCNVDGCGKVISACVDSDENHYCEICGEKSRCVDADKNGYCDYASCSAICFESGNLHAEGPYTSTIYVTKGNGFTAGTTAYDEAVAGNAYGGQYLLASAGQIVSIVDDPSGAANSVLRVVSSRGKTDGNAGGTTSYIDFNLVKNSDTASVLEFTFDYYIDYARKGSNATFDMIYATLWNGETRPTANNDIRHFTLRSLITSNSAADGVDTTDYALNTSTMETVKVEDAMAFVTNSPSKSITLDSHTWYKVKLIVADGVMYRFYSDDDGATWTYINNVAATGTYTTATLQINAYNNASRTYFDNISFVALDNATIDLTDYQ